MQKIAQNSPSGHHRTTLPGCIFATEAHIDKKNQSSAVAEMGDRGHNRHGPKSGGLLCPFRGLLRTRLIQSGLGRSLLPCQVASSSIPPFGHNRHGPKIGWGGCALFLGVAGSPSNTVAWAEAYLHTKWQLMHPAVWPQ